MITGTKSAVEAVADIRDDAAGLPLPYSIKINGKRTNVCPRCHTPIAPPWTCSECGWTRADGTAKARRQMCVSLASVVEQTDEKGKQTGVYETSVGEELKAAIATAKAKPSTEQSKDEKALSAVTVSEKEKPVEADSKVTI